MITQIMLRSQLLNLEVVIVINVIIGRYKFELIDNYLIIMVILICLILIKK